MKLSFEERRITCRGDHWIAPNAVVIGSVVLEPNASIWFGCVVRADDDTITIGENSQLQDGCVLHVDPGFPLTIGRNVSVGHMVMLHGCTIGDGTLIGIKSVILNGAKVGKNCLIGANSLIAEGKEIPDGSLVVGSPGRVVRKLSEEEIREIHSFSDHYVQQFKRYRANSTLMIKYGFRIRTRGGMIVENLQVQARDRDEAERKINQIYHQCEIIDCQEVTPTLKKEGLDLEDVISLINKQEDSER